MSVLGLGSPKVQLLLELKNKMKSALVKAKQSLNSDVDAMKAKLKELRSSHSEAFSSMAGDAPMFGNALKSIGNPYMLIIAGLTTVLSLGAKATTMAADWEKGMAKVNVTAQLQKKELKGLSHEILDIAERNTQPFEEVPDAFNRIVSAGMDTRSALKMLEPTLQAAKAGFTDVETTAKAAVNVMASSGINDAVRVYDILFATLNKGNAEFADIANYLPKIIPMARNAGISLEETAGAFAYLTAQGFKAEQASTGMINVFKALSDTRTIYGSKITKGFKGIGVEIFEATGKMKPMMVILKELKNAMKGLSDQQRVVKFDSIGLDTEASMTLSSMLQDYEKLSGIVDFTTNSQGQLNEAIKNSETSTDNWQRITNTVKGTMTEIGEAALPSIAEGLDIGYQKLLEIKRESKEWGEEMTWLDSAWEKIKLNIEYTVGAFGKIFEEFFSLIKAGSDLIENTKRFFAGGEFVSVQQERKNKQDRKEWEKTVDEYGKFFQDRNILNQVMKENNIRQTKLSPENIGTYNEAFNDLKKYTFAKQAFNNAMDVMLGSKDKSVQKFLNQYGIKGNEDFYRLMKEGKVNEVVDKLPGLMPKKAATTGTGGITLPSNVNGVDNVTSSAQQTRNISISIESFIKGDVISQNRSIQGMSKDELVRFFQDMFRRMIANAETMATG